MALSRWHVTYLTWKKKKKRRHCFCKFFLSQILWEDLNLAKQELKTDKSLVLPPLVFPQIPGRRLAFLKFSGTLQSKWNDIIDVVPVSLLFTLIKFHILFWCYHCWLWTSKYHVTFTLQRSFNAHIYIFMQ